MLILDNCVILEKLVLKIRLNFELLSLEELVIKGKNLNRKLKLLIIFFNFLRLNIFFLVFFFDSSCYGWIKFFRLRYVKCNSDLFLVDRILLSGLLRIVIVGLVIEEIEEGGDNEI